MLQLLGDAFGKKQRHSMTDNTKHGPKVKWGAITVSFHDIVLGDNPAVISGPPIQCSWKAAKTTIYDSLEAFEDRRLNDRVGEVLRLPVFERVNILKESGHDNSAIKAAMKQATIARNRRRATIKSNQRAQEQREEWWNRWTCKKEPPEIVYKPTATAASNSVASSRQPLKSILKNRGELLVCYDADNNILPFGKGREFCLRCTLIHMHDHVTPGFLFHTDEDCVLLQRQKKHQH